VVCIEVGLFGIRWMVVSSACCFGGGKGFRPNSDWGELSLFRRLFMLG
jgi:hypothetical protein